MSETLDRAEVLRIKTQAQAGDLKDEVSSVEITVIALCDALLEEREENLNAVNAAMDTANEYRQERDAALGRERWLCAELDRIQYFAECDQDKKRQSMQIVAGIARAALGSAKETP